MLSALCCAKVSKLQEAAALAEQEKLQHREALRSVADSLEAGPLEGDWQELLPDRFRVRGDHTYYPSAAAVPSVPVQ